MDCDFSKLTPAQEWLIVYLIGPLCSATGSNLIRQYIDLQRALAGDDVTRLVELMRAAA